MRKFFIFFSGAFLLLSCEDEQLPKQKGYLSLNYPVATYGPLELERPYTFDVSKQAIVKDDRLKWLKIQYPSLKASLDITYRPVQGNLTELLIESEKLVYSHVVKAEEIVPRNFENSREHVFGSMHQITGNAASQIQFHVTDSTRHFIKGALYFYTKPNYDSIFPAVEHVKKDIIRLVETLTWN